jgi:DNA-directed RNA polymerase specialized sigma24 family protein
MTQDEFDRLLAWLNDDPEQAGRKYEDIRQSLIKIFNWRGCIEAESLADEAINRVAARVHELEEGYVGDRAYYFYGVAKKLIYECRHYMKAQVPLDEAAASIITAPVVDEDEAELEHECLSHCIGKLDAASRELIMAYYSLDRGDKIEGRKVLAQRFDISINNLRVKVYRIRAVLEKCMRKCLANNGPK